MRTDRLADEYGLDVVYRHFPLHPEIPPEGMDLADLFAGREDELAAMRERLETAMDEAGLPYGDRTRTYNSRLAQELAAWADTRDDGRGIHDALFRAYFVDNRNLADPDVLVSVAESLGLPADEARRVLEERRYRDEVTRDWERARQLGLGGVPAYLADRYYVVGAQPYEVLEEMVTKAGAQRRGSQ